MKRIVAGIAAGRKYENYFNWIAQISDIEIIKLDHGSGNFDSLKKCEGVVLSGGEDVHPRFYNKPEYVEKYNLDDLDEARDEFELKILSYAQQNQMPVLGICRGLQIANVFYGGTLVPDIPSFGKPDHTKYGEGRDRYHSIHVIKKSLLETIAGVGNGDVNSAHHQCVDRLGNGLIADAFSDDGIIEGIERKEINGNPFMLLVQWHPERMADRQSVFSKNIRDSFVKSMRPEYQT